MFDCSERVFLGRVQEGNLILSLLWRQLSRRWCHDVVTARAAEPHRLVASHFRHRVVIGELLVLVFLRPIDLLDLHNAKGLARAAKDICPTRCV